MPGLICATDKVLPRVRSDILTLEGSRRVFIFSALVGWTPQCFICHLRSHASSLTLLMQQLLIPRGKLSSRVPLMHLFHAPQLSGMACCNSRAFFNVFDPSIPVACPCFFKASGWAARFRLRNCSACLTLLWPWTMCCSLIGERGILCSAASRGLGHLSCTLVE